NVRVKLNPADVELIRQSGMDIDKQEWKCVPDKTITQGGCMVESDTSHIDATLETRVSQIIDQLTENRPHYDDHD
ncbi:MAG TPA: FliH/SctL family protein, partial [Gammaproteobacteria bacterium]